MTVTNAQRLAFQYFVEKGWTPAQAAGIVGNLTQESSPNLDFRLNTAGGDNGASHGIAQWNGARLANLYAFGRNSGQDPNSLTTQLAFVDKELNGPEYSAGSALRGARDPASAARAFLGFERPQGWTPAAPEQGHGYANRVAHAQTLFAEMSGLPGAPLPPSGQAAPSAARAPAESPLAASPLAGMFVRAPVFAPPAQQADVTAAEQRRQALLGSIGSLFIGS